MRKLLFFCFIATSSLLGQQPTNFICFSSSSDPNYRCPATSSLVWQESFLHNPHCPFLVGIDMPAGKYPTKQTLYFVHRFTKPPQCFVDAGEAQIMDVNSEFVRFAGKPSSRVVIRCKGEE